MSIVSDFAHCPVLTIFSTLSRKLPSKLSTVNSRLTDTSVGAYRRILLANFPDQEIRDLNGVDSKGVCIKPKCLQKQNWVSIIFKLCNVGTLINKNISNV